MFWERGSSVPSRLRFLRTDFCPENPSSSTPPANFEVLVGDAQAETNSDMKPPVKLNYEKTTINHGSSPVPSTE